jgi:hypothetical protein
LTTSNVSTLTLLGAERGDVTTNRALMAAQDKLALTPEEQEVIELQRNSRPATNALYGIRLVPFRPENSR